MKVIDNTERLFEKISDNKVASAIRRGLLYIIPLIMVGSFVLLFLNLPISAFQTFMIKTFGTNWKNLPLSVYKGTFEIVSLAAVISISYAYGQSFESVATGHLNPFSLMLCGLCSYFTFNPIGEILINAEAANSTSLFTAILIAIVSTRIYIFLFEHIPSRGNVYSYDADSLLLYSLKNILPLMIVLFIFGTARILFDALGINDALNRFMMSLNEIFSSGHGDFATTLIFVLLIQILWFVGLHGTNILAPFAASIFLSASTVNITLAAAGQAPTQIVTKEFLDCFVFMGGAGCTLGLLLALLISGKTSNINRVAKYSLLPGLFNINETITYGLPLMFNPYYLIPFILSPLLLTIISYFAFWSGLIPLTMSRVEWTTPILLSGYVSTGSIAGALLQLINLAVSAAVYLPFVKLYEKHLERSNRKVFKNLSTTLISADPSKPHVKVLGRNDEMGRMARLLVSELEQAVKVRKYTALTLHYQPKVTADGKVYGAEALLRWTHPVYGYISPLLVIALCDEADLVTELGRWVIDTAYQQLEQWNKLGHKNLNLSVNLMPRQIKEDHTLLEYIQQVISTTGVSAHCVELELTEHEALDQSPATRHKLEQIRQTGINLSIDDFAMGNSSLLYIRDSFINIIKIDISLVHSVTTNHQSQEIIRSILSLCEQVNISVVAEGVETTAQLKELEQMGCHIYQGFLFSKALSPEDFLAYLEKSDCVDPGIDVRHP